MKLGDHLANLKERPSTYARRLKIRVPSITQYLKGQQGLSPQYLKIILDDAGGAMCLNDLVPNPYQDKGNSRKKATKKETLRNRRVSFFLGKVLATARGFYQRICT